MVVRSTWLLHCAASKQGNLGLRRRGQSEELSGKQTGPPADAGAAHAEHGDPIDVRET
jgi:hypothetical protein